MINNLPSFLDIYEILNYILQGYICTYALLYYKIDEKLGINLTYNVVFIFFVGFIISKIASLLVQKFLSKGSILDNIRYIPYYTDKDQRLKKLNMIKAFCRNTFTTLLLVLCLDIGFLLFASDKVRYLCILVVIFALLTLLYLSYRKQNMYIYKAINLLNSTTSKDINSNYFAFRQIENSNEFTFCPYCNNKNYLKHTTQTDEICYNCGTMYSIKENTGGD